MERFLLGICCFQLFAPLAHSWTKQDIENIRIDKEQIAYFREKNPGFGTEYVALPFNDSYIVGKEDAKNRMSISIFSSPDPEKVVTFRVYTRATSKDGDAATPATIPPSFDPSKTTKFITHGWFSNTYEEETFHTIKDNYLLTQDVNVVMMDWSKIADNLNYFVPSRNTYNVARFYAKFLNALIDRGAKAENFHLIGHSLGAHVSAFAARQCRQKVRRVTALDPAAPGFPLDEGGQLRRSDASFVDVIHTCGGILGLEQSVGHADFYPNGGYLPQPGCGNVLNMMAACSHGRSKLYFAESIITERPFEAYPCDTYLDNRRCGEEWVAMGEHVPETAQGVYLLKTGQESPFCCE